MAARCGGQHAVRQSIGSQGSRGFSRSRLGFGFFLTVPARIRARPGETQKACTATRPGAQGAGTNVHL